MVDMVLAAFGFPSFGFPQIREVASLLFPWSLLWFGLLKWVQHDDEIFISEEKVIWPPIRKKNDFSHEGKIPENSPVFSSEIATPVYKEPVASTIPGFFSKICESFSMPAFLFLVAFTGFGVVELNRFIRFPRSARLGELLIAFILWSLMTGLFLLWKRWVQQKTSSPHISPSKEGWEAEKEEAQTNQQHEEEWGTDDRIIVNIPTTLGTMTTLLAAVCALLLLFLSRDNIPAWLHTDLAIGLLASLVIKIFLKHRYIINTREKTVQLEYANLFYYRITQVRPEDISAITTMGTLSGWPIFWHWYKMTFSVAIVFTDGTAWPVPLNIRESSDSYQSLKLVTARAKALAANIGCTFRSALFEDGQSYTSWVADVEQMVAQANSPDALRLALWKTKFSNFSLDVEEAGYIKVDLATFSEKIVLVLLVLWFVISTNWIVDESMSFIRANPRMIYLFLLDSTSVLVTLYAAWIWLVDQHYVLDMEKRMVLSKSRFLWIKTEKPVSRFDDIDRFHVWRRHSWFFHIFKGKGKYLVSPDEYFVRMTSGASDWQMSDCMHWGEKIAFLRAAVLNKLVYSKRNS
ncbi:MAG: hypothetical protein HQM10_13905 [Candidatus Riflebacteria bacterium]|nr:hypothetical protein [Candidatus Riflebacteria bacterium]